MQEERKRILDMVENGTITAQEALALLEELGKQATIVTPPVNTQKFEEEKKTEQVKQGSADFIEDLKRDFTMVGDRFMQFMQGTVDKMKDFEFEMKFNDPVTFEEKFVKQDVQFDDISINLTNGKVNIFPSEEPFAHATVKVKSFKNSTEEEARKRFQEEFIFTTEGNKLRVYSDMKTISVQVALFVPEKEYNHISARLFNGDFVAQNLEANTFKIKTTNGKVELENSKFHRADIETVNGSVQLQHVEGDTVEVETMNGRIYVDGKLKEIEGSSVSGHVILTTKDKEARKIEGTAVAGTVEIYVPKDISLKGETTTQLGRIDVQLTDVTQINQSEQVLNKRVAFTKVVDSEKEPLRIYGDAKTGSVVVRYTTEA
ncbi:DUF4097 family beta strand repeat-containing protein [Psychrobacillus sp. MER TA 171]|uniref:DUF4097 family beta strand repeat-containing protein n=1 Tax=Psychrobacillus sp. MER TA 171 TaxID=2939577 RepID=UPI00203FCBD6|nr:DUF4097 family beta strand repeat-containing protein [Psychrobacillus sp. MER TA 171]MCM3358727.1 DUF4097 family beta strand repeat-containing protein [Psychrobacillus sp. MER TA 171]